MMLQTITLLVICTFLMNFVAVFSGELEQLESVLTKFDSDYRQRNLTKLKFDFKSALTDFGDGRGSKKSNDVQDFLKKMEENDELEAMETLESRWSHYLSARGKYYSGTEKNHRMAIYESNKLFTEKLNKQFKRGTISYEAGLNNFADLTDEEFRTMNGFIPPNGNLLAGEKITSNSYFRHNPRDKLPHSVDWRRNGYVTHVRNQGICGSCYAFAAAGALEAYYKKKTGRLVNLSPQNIVDCTKNLGNKGCIGGYYTLGFRYAMSNGIALDSSYPYIGSDSQRCRWHQNIAAVTDRGFLLVKPGSEVGLQHAVAKYGPVAVAIDATSRSFRFYKRGIYFERNCNGLNHAVLVVGYGSDRNYGDYWIVKNSWGSNWGDGGYVYMARNKGNMCGIATHAAFPV